MKPIILSLEGVCSKPVDESDAQKKVEELQNILDQLEEKEKTVREIHVDCEQYGAQYGDVQKFIKELLLGLTSNIQVIRENQNCIRNYLVKLKELPQEVVQEPAVIEEVKVVPVQESLPTIEDVKPETQAMSTQTVTEQRTDNIMVIQSVNDEGETIQIYSMPGSHDENREDDRNVIVEAKYVRSHSGEPKKASELVLKNVPKHFETTFVEPDESTTEIIVDPDGSKRIILRKLTKTVQQTVSYDQYDNDALPEHIRSQLGLSGTTHDVILGSSDHQQFEQHPDITESSIHAVIEHVSNRVIRKTRKIIKKIVIIDGEEHITEEVIEEPDEIEEYTTEHPAIGCEHVPSDDQATTEIVEIVTDVEVITEDEVMPAVIKTLTDDVVTVEKVEPVVKLETEKTPEVSSESERKIEIEQATEPAPESTPKVVEELAEVPQKPVEKEVEPTAAIKTEGDNNQPEQVFETITEAPVELTASEVDKLTPIENIENIWPHKIPHITSQSTAAESIELPAPTQQDKDSQSIWPQNLTIGSDVDFNEYSFDRTLEKSSDYLDNDSFVVVDSGVNPVEEPSNIENRFAVEEEDILQTPIKQKPIEIVQEIVEVSAVPEQKPEPVEPEILEDIKSIPATPEKSSLHEETPASIPSSPKQMATITIVKTMTFLEQEKINAEATMFVTTENVNESVLSQADRSMGEEIVIEDVKVPEPQPIVEEVQKLVTSIEHEALAVQPDDHDQLVQEVIKPENMKPIEPTVDVPDASSVAAVEIVTLVKSNIADVEPREIEKPSAPKEKDISVSEMFISSEIGHAQPTPSVVQETSVSEEVVQVLPEEGEPKVNSASTYSLPRKFLIFFICFRNQQSLLKLLKARLKTKSFLKRIK